jgi:hypothetical protein
MTKGGTRHWGRWAAGIVGALVALKGVAMVVAGIFSFTKNEVRARGGDVNFVLGLADRRKTQA